jgi:hypothetical protein
MSSQNITDLVEQLPTMDYEKDDTVIADYALCQFDGQFCFAAASRALDQYPVISDSEITNDFRQQVALIIPKLYSIQLQIPSIVDSDTILPGAPFATGVNLQYIKEVIKLLSSEPLAGVVYKLQNKLNTTQQNKLNTTQQDKLITQQAIALYDPDVLVRNWELIFQAPEAIGFESAWQHQHQRGLAWYYCQDMQLLLERYVLSVIKAAKTILIDTNHLDLMRQNAKDRLKLAQLKQILGVLKNVQ